MSLSQKCPCKGCVDKREELGLGCHGRCDEYKEWRGLKDKENEEARKARSKYTDLYVHKKDGIIKARRGKGVKA